MKKKLHTPILSNAIWSRFLMYVPIRVVKNSILLIIKILPTNHIREHINILKQQ